MAALAGVAINTYKVIYNLIDDVKAAMEGKLRAVEEKQQLGEATVSPVVPSKQGRHVTVQPASHAHWGALLRSVGHSQGGGQAAVC